MIEYLRRSDQAYSGATDADTDTTPFPCGVEMEYPQVSGYSDGSG